MAGTIGAEEGALDAGAKAALAASAAIRRTSNDVEREVEATRGRWVGVGSDQFRALMKQWDEKTEAMIKVLDQLAADLTDVADALILRVMKAVPTPDKPLAHSAEEAAAKDKRGS